MVGLVVTLLVTLYSSCNKWENRDKKEAKHYCKCVQEWQEEMSPQLIGFYDQVSNAMAKYPDELQTRLDDVRRLKIGLSKSDRRLNQEFARAFLDPNSKLYKCWNKPFPWEGEYRGNNTKYTVPHEAKERGCDLASSLTAMGYLKEVFKALED